MGSFDTGRRVASATSAHPVWANRISHRAPTRLQRHFAERRDSVGLVTCTYARAGRHDWPAAAASPRKERAPGVDTPGESRRTTPRHRMSEGDPRGLATSGIDADCRCRSSDRDSRTTLAAIRQRPAVCHRARRLGGGLARPPDGRDALRPVGACGPPGGCCPCLARAEWLPRAGRRGRRAAAPGADEPTDAVRALPRS